jgi:hypothetical protein
MSFLPALILLSLTATLGVYLALAFLKRWPRRPMLIGLHLLFGAGSLEGLVIALHAEVLAGSAPDAASSDGPNPLEITMLGLIGLALISGLVRAAVGSRTRAVAMATLALHAALATAGVAVALRWISRHFLAA